MHRAFTRPIARTRSRAAVPAVLLLVAGVFAGTVAASPSGAAPPSGGVQTTLVLSTPTTTNTADLAGAPTNAIPGVLAQKKVTPILTTLTVSDGSELSKGTVVNLTAVKVSATGAVTAAAGTFTPASFTVPARGTTFAISVIYSAADTDVVIKAALKKSTNTSPGPGLSTAFDVVDTLQFASQGDPKLRTGFGSDECTASSKVQVCGVVLLPNGINSAAAALSSGICADAGCTGAEEVQFIAGLEGLYTKTAPAKLLLRCDKSKCAGKGVSSYTAKIALTSSGALANSPACPSKGVLGTDQHFCTDYVSSNRDNAGDLILDVLFDIDMRGTM
jgi:hypothetical protein